MVWPIIMVLVGIPRLWLTIDVYDRNVTSADGEKQEKYLAGENPVEDSQDR